MSSRKGPPKHQNQYAWNPNAGHKKNETEVGGKLRPYSEVTGVCPRCREQIEWKRRYGKYKPLVEPAKCQKCGKRAVRQAYHNLCTACAKESGVCAKCSCRVDRIIGRDVEELEAERKALDEALKNARERDRRTLLRAMNKNKTDNAVKTPPPVGDRSREGDLFPATSIDEYAEANRDYDDANNDEYHICN
ncbi:small acidic-like protein [Tasmannia lanceolata]|uniref:small acidic-like protein n=1 Tax=Tasmannia lanceolata TaxID=3420 RepID=UPI00406312B3